MALGFLSMQDRFSKISRWERQRGYSVYAGICSHMEPRTRLPELLFLLVPICQKLAGKEAKGEKPERGTCDDLHKMQEISSVQYLAGPFLVPTACAKENVFLVSDGDYCDDSV